MPKTQKILIIYWRSKTQKTLIGSQLLWLISDVILYLGKLCARFGLDSKSENDFVGLIHLRVHVGLLSILHVGGCTPCNSFNGLFSLFN
ncbi:hypothetical protein F0562_023881 [Nyssa sinensis]|uniref:Uncharacterized protein n=1 Tax=Nyssa sinensis TaxID=561372 RepID=A0A5J5BIX8_9ASTE|nr:hypothetical protein F0562_023881 [Nyssa sinensis]